MKIWAAGGALLVALAAVTSCSAPSHSGLLTEVRDSAGVRVVTHTVDGSPLPTFAEVGAFDLEIGVQSGDPDYSFSRIGGVRSLRGGVIVVADSEAQTLRTYSADGLYLRTLGGPGEGPGEFSALTSIAGVSGDTVFVWDARNRRVSSFTADGVLREMTTLASEATGRPLRVIRLEDGSYVARSRWLRSGRVPGSYDTRLERDSMVVTHMDAKGHVLDTIRVMADMESLRSVRDMGDGRIRVRTFRRTFGRTGFVVSDGISVWTAWNADYQIIRQGLSDERSVVISVVGLRRPPTAADVAAALDAILSAGPDDPTYVRTLTSVFADFPPPEYLPAFSDVVVDSDHNLWVAEYVPLPAKPSSWHVFAPDGSLLGVVAVPQDLQLREIGRNHLLAVVLDDFDVPYVRRYPLTFPE